MRLKFPIMILAGLVLGLAGCETVETTGTVQPLEKLASRSDVVHIPYETYGDGLFMIPVSVNGHPPLSFIIDTGATRSAIYRSSARQLDLPVDEQALVTIHGITESATLPSLTVNSISLGSAITANPTLAVLKDNKEDLGDFSRIKGIIGMDILGQYRLLINAQTLRLTLIPKTAPIALKPVSWKYIPLNSNPYLEDGRALKYMNIRVQGRLSPALLDTGSIVNLMNWEIARDPFLKAHRRKMRADWTLKGAVGEFDPVIKVKFKNFRSGEKRWDERDFLVKDINSLEVLGIAGKPFVIAGVNLMSGKSLYLDFDNNVLFMESGKADKRREAVTGSRVGNSSQNVTTIVPATRN